MSKKQLRGHFDGRVLVLDQPADLPVNHPLFIEVSSASLPSTVEALPLNSLVELARQHPATGLPKDTAAQHDHYLYGSPKRQ